MFNIGTFLGQALPLGGARPSLFMVDITLPVGLGFAATTSQKSEVLVKAASIPPAPLDTIQVPYFGRFVKLAGDRNFPDWTVTVMNDEDFPLRTAFEKWSNAINAMRSNRMDPSAYPLIYKSTARVLQLGKEGDFLRAYLFQGIFPTNVDQMQLDWGAQNQLQEYDVTFAYDWWEPDTTVTGLNGKDNFSGTLASDGLSG